MSYAFTRLRISCVTPTNTVPSSIIEPGSGVPLFDTSTLLTVYGFDGVVELVPAKCAFISTNDSLVGSPIAVSKAGAFVSGWIISNSTKVEVFERTSTSAVPVPVTNVVLATKVVRAVPQLASPSLQTPPTMVNAFVLVLNDRTAAPFVSEEAPVPKRS